MNITPLKGKVTVSQRTRVKMGRLIGIFHLLVLQFKSWN